MFAHAPGPAFAVRSDRLPAGAGLQEPGRSVPMHDIRWIRDNPEAFDAGLNRRGLDRQATDV
jgi:hypothetical protein